MSSVGACLREMRLKHGFSVAEIARSTRVTSRYLVALESDEFSELPPPVFTRGFIRAFCAALGEPSETVLALYDQQCGATEHTGQTAPPRRVTGASQAKAAPMAARPTRGRSALFVSFILLVGLGASLFAVVMALQRGRTAGADKQDVAMVRRDGPADASVGVPPAADANATAAAPLPPSGLAPSQDAGGTPTSRTAPVPRTDASPTVGPSPAGPPGSAAPAAPTAPATSSSTGSAAPAVAGTADVPAAGGRLSAPYRLVARTRAPTWLRVRTEGGHATEENVPAGEVREWVSNRPFVVTVGNAGGVAFELNGEPLPPLGNDGVVVRDLTLPGPR
jgi:cytoskeleton protein RodZ